MAADLLEHNQLNRPLSDQHVKRIARQIVEGKWRFNGDTIKIAKTGDVLDGQHRLWAILEAKRAIETIVVRGIEREAFATIDTLRKPRSGADTIALCGSPRHRNIIASALTWLIRWQRGIITEYKAPQHKIENSDIEAAFSAHPGIVRAVERANTVRNIGNAALIAFFYYVLANRNLELAERLIHTLDDPSVLRQDDPFFKLRKYFVSDHHKRKEPEVTIALMIKAANLVNNNQRTEMLTWKNQGAKVEAFPVLKV